MNKERLQTYNNKLINNNIDLKAILQSVKDLPMAGGANEYAQDGLLALFDARDRIGTDGKWKSQIGSDYWSITNYSGTISKLNQMQTEDALVTDGTVSIRNNVDYYKDGYTIEMVCSTEAGNTYGHNFLCFDKSVTVHINIGRYGAGIFSPQYGTVGEVGGSCDYLIKGLNDGKRHTVALHLKQRQGNRNNTGGLVVLYYSVDGSPWYEFSHWVGAGGSYQSNYCTLMSYYSTNSSGRCPAGGTVSCVRVYNRLLNKHELYDNYMLDKANFGVV